MYAQLDVGGVFKGVCAVSETSQECFEPFLVADDITEITLYLYPQTKLDLYFIQHNYVDLIGGDFQFRIPQNQK